MKILVTGSSGLIGSEAVHYFCQRGHIVYGFDNNMRATFFGPQGDTTWNCNHLINEYRNFLHASVDIRDLEELDKWFLRHRFDAVIHCAAQPSHDKAKEIPITDFEVNAVGTLNLLECVRKRCPGAVFIFMSTNKVYGDAPNELKFFELEKRYDYGWKVQWDGFDEHTRMDQSTHSIFGVSKAAADLMVQEYGRYFGLKTTVLRGGCLTGPSHSGVELHGFLSYLIKVAVKGEPYRIFGYKGKQVRDNIHSHDVLTAMDQIIQRPGYGRVYNIGGGRQNSCSILEVITMLEERLEKKIQTQYIDQPRVGDHICYITDMNKFRQDYPGWSITRTLPQILEEIIRAV